MPAKSLSLNRHEIGVEAVMSLESGRKLGLTASLIAIIVPVIIGILYALLIFSIIAAFTAPIVNGGNSTTLASFLFPFGLIFLLIAVGITSLIGFILFIVAMYRLSQYYKEPRIFRNILYSLITIIVGVITMGAILAALIASARTISTVSTPSTAAPLAGEFIASILAVAGAFFVILIVSAFFNMRAFNKLGEKSGNQNFNTAGLLFLIGAVLSIVFIGSIIGWIAWIFAAMGFNSLKPKTTETSTFTNSTPQTAGPSIQQKRFCPYCGIENTADSVYCVSCGKQLQ